MTVPTQTPGSPLLETRPPCRDWCGKEMACGNSLQCRVAGGLCWCSDGCADARKPLRPPAASPGMPGAKGPKCEACGGCGWEWSKEEPLDQRYSCSACEGSGAAASPVAGMPAPECGLCGIATEPCGHCPVCGPNSKNPLGTPMPLTCHGAAPAEPLRGEPRPTLCSICNRLESQHTNSLAHPFVRFARPLVIPATNPTLEEFAAGVAEIERRAAAAKAASPSPVGEPAAEMTLEQACAAPVGSVEFMLDECDGWRTFHPNGVFAACVLLAAKFRRKPAPQPQPAPQRSPIREMVRAYLDENPFTNSSLVEFGELVAREVCKFVRERKFDGGDDIDGDDVADAIEGHLGLSGDPQSSADATKGRETR